MEELASKIRLGFDFPGEARFIARAALDELVAVALTYRQPTPCNCRERCMDADDEEGTCKGLPMPKEPPLVEMVLVPRALSTKMMCSCGRSEVELGCDLCASCHREYDERAHEREMQKGYDDEYEQALAAGREQEQR